MISKDALILRVKAVLNECGEDITLSITDDYVMLVDYIRRALPDAVALLAKEGIRINPKEYSFTITNDMSRVELPEDFISFISLFVDGWNRSVVKLVEKNSVEYKRASNIYTAPGIYNPVAWRECNDCIAFSPSIEGNAVLSYNAILEDNLNGDEKAIDAVVYMAAALVCSYFENDNGKKRLSELAISFIQ